MNHIELKKTALARPGVRDGYDAMGPEFDLLQQMLRARTRAGLSQAEVAARMGTHAPAVTRLEGTLNSGRHSPSLTTLKRYADAVGCELRVRLVAK